jgi:hypothetical protein
VAFCKVVKINVGKLQPWEGVSKRSPLLLSPCPPCSKTSKSNPDITKCQLKTATSPQGVRLLPGIHENAKPLRWKGVDCRSGCTSGSSVTCRGRGQIHLNTSNPEEELSRLVYTAHVSVMGSQTPSVGDRWTNPNI